jgi:hypothetical protein
MGSGSRSPHRFQAPFAMPPPLHSTPSLHAPPLTCNAISSVRWSNPCHGAWPPPADAASPPGPRCSLHSLSARNVGRAKPMPNFRFPSSSRSNLSDANFGQSDRNWRLDHSWWAILESWELCKFGSCVYWFHYLGYLNTPVPFQAISF